MFYVFHQNNSFGKFLKPAREVIVETDSEAEALHIVQTIDGVYFKGSSDRDCPCCGPRWSRMPLEYGDEEFAEYMNSEKSFMSWASPNIPSHYIRYKDGSVKVQDIREKEKDSVPQTMDAPMPEPVPMETQEYSAPVEGEN